MRRRDFLRSGTALLAPWPLLAGSGEHGLVLSAATDSAGRHHVIGLDGNGRQRFATPLPARAHGVSLHPHGHEAVVSARRPGRWLLVLELPSGRIKQTLHSAADRHYQGHAVYNADGSRLYATANAYEAGHGVVEVRAADAGYRPIAEWHSGGVGPHELLYLADDSLVVASGGLLTHPDSGRQVLNLDTMRPNLARLDAIDGGLLATNALAEEWRHASIRHLSALAGQTIAVAMQHQGNSRGLAPLVAVQQPGGALTPLWAPRKTQLGLRDYCGSVRADRSGGFFAVTSPRGNRVMFWNRAGDYLGEHGVDDGCGVAATERAGEFLVSNGAGDLALHDCICGQTTTLTANPAWRLDNHLHD